MNDLDPDADFRFPLMSAKYGEKVIESLVAAETSEQGNYEIEHLISIAYVGRKQFDKKV